ncbi:MAG: DUF5103 domain-containing protein [Deltaproteobacteria bacterium]
MRGLRSFLLIFTVFYSSYVFTQDISRSDDYVFVSNIRSVKFYAGNNPLSYPLSDLSGSIPLFFEFDDTDGDSKSYYYKIVHCDMDWKISELNESDFLSGFNGVEIKDPVNSSFTLTQYTHYKLRLPNKDVRWSVSGNFLLVVYDDNDEIVISKRFLVSENKVRINAYIDHARDVSKFYTHHGLKVDLNIKDYYIVDPVKELKVSVLQNNKWIDAVKNVSPKYWRGDDISFDEFDPFLFKALNEFHYFDIRSLRATNLEIRSIDVSRKGVEVMLESDHIRKYGNYFFHNDINGNFLLLNLDNQNINSAQYADVNFKLKTSAPIKDHDVYVTGGFCEWQLYDDNKMFYEPESESYKAKLFLKQGVYDYYYAITDKSGKIDFESTEGSWYETENDYMILVYQRPFGGRYDKLVGIRVIE